MTNLLLASLLVCGVAADAKDHQRLLRHSIQSSLAADVGAADAEGVQPTRRAARLKSAYPWYHTSEELQTEAARLLTNCKAEASKSTAREGDVSLDVITVRAKGAKPTNRVFILFGEHSRELISPESGIRLLRQLCGQAPEAESKVAEQTLQDSEFQLVLNANPRSRLKVEDGDYCVRMNPDGVDLNRNWDEKWQPQAAAFANTNPGPRPFSEPETRLLKQLVTEYKPTTFLTVHSGTRGLYMPWAYDMEHLADRNQPSMLEILRDLDQKHCQCPFGAAGREVGYSCPGTCLDYVYDQLKTPYSFAFEIYASPDVDSMLRERWQEKMASGGAALLQQGHHLGHQHFADLFHNHTSDFVHLRSSSLLEVGSADVDEDPAECFSQFNPATKETYEHTVRNWATAYLEMAQRVAADLRKNSGKSV